MLFHAYFAYLLYTSKMCYYRSNVMEEKEDLIVSMRSSLAIGVGKASHWFLKNFLNRGSSFPGQLALKIDPNVLTNLTDDYEVIVVSGTNGKTLTTALIVNILKAAFGEVITNPSGANLAQGIVATFLQAKLPNNQKRKFAVLEIDEATLPKVTQYFKPDLFVFTNIFRDQLDRYGEIYTTYQLLQTAANQAPDAPILANGDLPIFNDSSLQNPQKFYGFVHKDINDMMADESADGILCSNCHSILHYHYLTYANQGNYYCPHCDFKRPKLDYQLTSLDNITEHSATFTVDGEQYSIPIGGMYNIYNALAAIAVGEYYGIDAQTIKQGLVAQQAVFGRQESININGKKVTIMLVKNPVGLNQVIDTMKLADYPYSLVTLLNDDWADGRDISWIWDGHYETLNHEQIPKVLTGGTRINDMTLRMKVAGFDNKIQEVPVLSSLPEQISELPTEHVYVLATYTAMTQLRHLLNEKGYLKGGTHQA